MNNELKECLLCRRIEYNELALYAFQIWPDEEARKNIETAANLIKDTYIKNPPLLCGKSPKTIMAATLYLSQLFNEKPSKYTTQGEISKIINITESAIRATYKLIWIENKIDSNQGLNRKFWSAIRDLKNKNSDDKKGARCWDCNNIRYDSGTSVSASDAIYKCEYKKLHSSTSYNSLFIKRICENFEPVSEKRRSQKWQLEPSGGPSPPPR